MNNLINYFWNPGSKAVKVFNYGTFIISAPVMLLAFFLPGLLVLGSLFIFFILKSIVTIRAAATIKIDEEKKEKYVTDPTVAKRAYIIFSILICVFISGIVILSINLEGVFGILLAIFMATITLPGFFEEIIIIKRCQTEYKSKV